MMKKQKCQQCDKEFNVLDQYSKCPQCSDVSKDAIDWPSRNDEQSIQETVDKSLTARDSDGGKSPNPAKPFLPVSAPTLPPKIGDEGEPEGLRERDVDEGESPEFKLIEELDQGSYGKVFRSLQVSLDREVAVKILKEKFHAKLDVRADFFKEAQITGRLEHPNIIPIHDIGVASGGDESGSPFYVMKEIKGTSWDDAIRSNSREENLSIFQRVVDAVGFAHSNNILHCDLKPKNVMLGEFGEVLVVDWGHAIDMTQPNSYRPGGTLAYMSPEMAGYYMDPKSGDTYSHLKWEIGPGSDVYLLGAILFEIVTGCYPHFDPRNDTEPDPQDGSKRIYPSDKQLKSWALNNRLCNYEEHEGDELLQISLRALRKESEEIVTVEQLQEALKTYQTHGRSIEIRNRSFQLLEEAKQTSDYDTFQKAKIGFEEAIDLWNENKLAKEGLQTTRLACAEVALRDQNFDLGIGVLGHTENEDESRLKRTLEKGKRRRDQRLKALRLMSAAFALAVVVGLATSITFYLKAMGQTAIAKQKDEEAKKSKKDADDAWAKAEDAKTREEAAIAEKNIATTQAEIAERKAISKEADAEAQQEIANVATYRATNISIEENIANGDFSSSWKSLESLEKKFVENSLPFELRRLRLLSQPKRMKNSVRLDGARSTTLTADRTTIVALFDDRIEVRDVQNPDVSKAKIKVSNISVLKGLARRHAAFAVSADGRAIAFVRDGKIEVHVTKDGRRYMIEETLDGQSDSITGLTFSHHGTRLVSVGIPDKIRKSIQREHELMFWQFDGAKWQPLAPTKFAGNRLNPVTAIFSKDGNRVLAASAAIEQRAFLLELQNGADSDRRQNGAAHFEAIRFLPAKIKNAVFADSEGRIVIGSTSAGLNSYQIVVSNIGKSTEYRSKELDSEILQLDFDGENLVVLTEDKRAHVWPSIGSDFSRLRESPIIYRGHSKLIGLTSNTKELEFLSYAVGSDPVILRTNTSDYVKEEIRFELEENLTDSSVPTSFSQFHDSDHLILGNDRGLVSINERKTGKPVLKWEISAWKQHLITEQHLFARSHQDYLYRYNLVTGELEKVITKLSDNSGQENSNEESFQPISTLAISDDSRFAVLQRDNGRKEFEVWDLGAQDQLVVVDLEEKDKRPNEKRFGELNEDQLRHLTISADGKWVAGGKVSCYVWRNDGTFIGSAGFENGLEEPVDSIRFLSDSSRLVTAYGNRIKEYDVGQRLIGPRIYKIDDMPNSPTAPNIVAAKEIDGDSYLLLRKLVKSGEEVDVGLQLVRLGSDARNFEPVTFPKATNGSFFENSVVVATRDPRKSIVIYDIMTGKENPIALFLDLSASQLRSGEATFLSERRRFNRVYKNREGDFVVNWQVAGKNSTVSTDNNGQIKELAVIANPAIESVGGNSDRAMTFASSKIQSWSCTIDDPGSVEPKTTIRGNYRLVEFSPNANRAFVIDANHTQASVLDLTTGSLAKLELIELHKIRAVTWDSTGSKLAIGYEDGGIELFDTLSGNSKNLQLASEKDAKILVQPKELEFSKDGQALLVVVNAIDESESQRFIGSAIVLKRPIVEDENKAPQSNRQPNNWIVAAKLSFTDKDSIESASISSDGNRVITGSRRGRITLWRTEVRQQFISAETNEPQHDEAVEPTNVDDGRELLTVGNLENSIRSVGFLDNDSGVFAIQEGVPDAILYPASPVDTPAPAPLR